MKYLIIPIGKFIWAILCCLSLIGKLSIFYFANFLAVLWNFNFNKTIDWREETTDSCDGCMAYDKNIKATFIRYYTFGNRLSYYGSN